MPKTSASMLRALVATGLLVTGCGGSPHADDTIIATDARGPITQQAYDTWLIGTKAEDSPESRLGNLKQLSLARALAAEVTAPDDQLRFALDLMADQALERSLRAGLATEISDAELEAELERRDAERVQPRKMQLRNLFKRVEPGADAATRARVRAEIEDLRTQLLAGADFGELARAHSDSQTRVRGGRMGMVESDQLPPSLATIADGLGAGEISEVLSSTDGFTLIRCERIVEARTMSKDEARGRLRPYLERQRRRDAWRSLQETLVATARAAIDVEAARAADTAEDAVIVSTTGPALSRQQVRWLLATQPTHPELATISAHSLQSILEAWVVTTFAAQYARDEGLDQRPEVAAKLHWQRQHVLGAEALQRRIQARFSAPDATALRAHYDADPTAFERPAEYRLAVIRIPAEGEARNDKASDVAELAAALRAGRRSFEEEARQHSRHPSASNGGHLPWLPTPRIGQLGPDVLGTTERLAVDETSSPVWQDGAYWIIRKLGEQAPRIMTFDEAKPRIENALGNQQAQTIRAEIEQALIDELAVELAS